MLSNDLLEQILERIAKLRIGVLGDLFLDRYLDIDAQLDEPSIETGLTAYQVVQVRSQPGAAGTVINNLAALGVGSIVPIAVIGDDGEGYELRQALNLIQAVSAEAIFSFPDRRTPTYTKPMRLEPGQPARELNRLDIKNRTATPREAEDQILRRLERVWPLLDALVVLDQVSEADCGVVTRRVRERLAELGAADPQRFVLADSREQIRNFRNVCLKPNLRECLGSPAETLDHAKKGQSAVAELAKQLGRTIFSTCGEDGIIVAEPGAEPVNVPAYPVSGPIDPVGAGDSVSAGIACARAAGASLVEAAQFGNLVASITIQQLGTTGAASPAQVRARRREVSTRQPSP